MESLVHFSKKIILSSFLLSCASENYQRLYHLESKAPSLSWEELENLDHMGPTMVDRGVNFSVYSENATRIELVLFDDPESELPTQQYEMDAVHGWYGIVRSVTCRVKRTDILTFQYFVKRFIQKVKVE